MWERATDEGPANVISSNFRSPDFAGAVMLPVMTPAPRNSSKRLVAKIPSLFFVAALSFGGGMTPGFGADESVMTLPPGVKAVWDSSKAYHETTPTRERICLNGLWQWQPSEARTETVPSGNWGYFKVPGCWPGISDYEQKDCQTVYAHPSWSGRKLADLSTTWYQRQITIPENWTGRRLTLSFEYLNSYGVVYLDGTRAGEIRFPGGELDITSFCRPGQTHTLALFVAALPLKGVMLSYTDSASAREVKGSVPRRGLCGDVFLAGTPGGPRLDDVRTETSVRKKECVFDTSITNLAPDIQYALRARILDHASVIHEYASPKFRGSDLKEGRVAFTEKWMPDRLWDLPTPQNIFDLEISLLDSRGAVLDTSWNTRLAFRELWIEGRDFFLNGSRIFLSAVPLDNAQVSAAASTYAAARESMERLKSFGINFVYTHNYGCEPGSHLGFEEILRAADDEGMLVSFSQPHFSHYDWKAPDAAQNNGYARHAEYYVRAARNHPSVVMYSMSHNATGYDEDMNPDMIDGIQAPRDTWARKNVLLATQAEEIVRRLDPTRIVYHHASGNLGSMHSINFYPNFAPVQELSDWFEHWATTGVKPVFTCEYGAPFTWDWTMYRGWYKGQREFGSATVPWEFCVAEWDSQFFGDRAFQIGEEEKTNLRWEAAQFRAGKVWHRWDYPFNVGSSRFEQQYPVFALYLTENWRAFRTWGVSAISPWEHEHFWKLRDGVDKSRKEFKTDWENLQRPGFSPDYLDERNQRMDLAFERSDWVPTVAAEALMRNNRPLLAYIGGKPSGFTSKDHNFLPGETVEKQIIVINNSRQTVSCDCQWSLNLPTPLTGGGRGILATGEQKHIPLRFKVPDDAAPGRHVIDATIHFSTGEIQKDSFIIDILPAPMREPVAARIALFDPAGQTSALLTSLGIRSQPVETNTDLSAFDILIVGKAALTVDSPAPDISRVADGLKVVIFEQTSEVLEKRFGFRVEEYGLRQVFARVPDHPALAGLTADLLHDWRGAATILPPRLKYETRPRYGVTVKWCDILVTRLWRCGNRGNVASVLMEKPGRGDFLPVIDGGFSLQFSPLMEYREGRGCVIFCQMDVTGRTEEEPSARLLAGNILRYVTTWTPAPRRKVLYAGAPTGKSYLESVGLYADSYSGSNPSSDQALVVGPGGGETLAPHATEIAGWLKNGGKLLAIGLDQSDTGGWLPFELTTGRAEHISTFFEPAGIGSATAGIGPADAHNRDPRQFPLVSGGARIIGDGILATSDAGNAVFCQLEPWQFDAHGQSNLRRTSRRVTFLVSRLFANMGVAAPTPVLERFRRPIGIGEPEKRWLSGFYNDQPEEWDDPYRHFRW